METNTPDIFSARAKKWDNPAKITMTKAFVARINEINIVGHNSTIIETGCGTGLVGLEFADMAEQLIMVDTSAGMLEVLQEKIESRNLHHTTIVHGDLSEVTNKADVILAFMVLHHIENTGQFIIDAKERLKDNGILIIGDLYPEDGLFHPGSKVPHNGFEPEWLGHELGLQGFRQIKSGFLTTVERQGGVFELFILTAVK